MFTEIQQMTGHAPHAMASQSAGHDEPAGPERRCLATGAVRPKAELLRFVVGPDGQIVPDLQERLPGRGLWLSAKRAAIEEAVKRKAFARAARRAVEVPEDLAERLTALLGQRVLERLSLAKRAGVLVAGHDKVRAWLESGQAAVLLQAADAAPEGKARLGRLGQGVKPGLETFEAFGAEELGKALGREQAVHIALKPGGLARALSVELKRFLAVQGSPRNVRG